MRRTSPGPEGNRTVGNQQEELTLIRAAAAGNEAAMEQVLLRYKNQIAYLARQYRVQGVEIDDLEQEGLLAICRAVQTFDERRRVRFVTWVVHQIRGKMLEYVRNHACIIRRKTRNLNDPDHIIRQVLSLDVANEDGQFPAANLADPRSPRDPTLRLRIEEALSRIEPRRRRALIALTWEEKTNKEVAREMNRSGGRVNQLYHEAAEKFIKAFEG